jgi:hypothetical protein
MNDYGFIDFETMKYRKANHREWTKKKLLVHFWALMGIGGCFFTCALLFKAAIHTNDGIHMDTHAFCGAHSSS